MKRLQPALAASLSVLVGLAAFLPVADARGGGGFGGHGGFGGGGFAGHPGGYGGSPGLPGGYGAGARGDWGANGKGYGFYPGHTNPYANNAWVGPVDISGYTNGTAVPPNNSGSSLPNDCDYLFKEAVESNSPSMWNLFNACAHNR
jgi:hypothetical protein